MTKRSRALSLQSTIQSTRWKTLFCILILLFSFSVLGARTAHAGPTPSPTATPTATPTPIPTLAPLPQPAQAAFDQKVVARLSADRAVKHVAYLSETIGPRTLAVPSG